MDDVVTVGQLRAEARRFTEERDWARFHAPKDLAVAIAAESGELLERFLWRERADPAAVAEELADVVIYCLHLANAAGIDLSDAVRAKMAANAAKYPAEAWRGRAP